jgi:Fe-S-cluster containining protein
MANNYIQTLSTTISAMISDEDISEVPCGTCNMCCKLFTPYLTPKEIASGQYPLSLIDGPEGPIVALYRKPEGGCGMLIDDKCSIYENRPLSCRQYDCRKGHHTKTNHIAKEKFGIDL